MDNNSYWRNRYGFPVDWGRVEFPRFANWVTFVMEEPDPQTGMLRAHRRLRAYLDHKGIRAGTHSWTIAAKSFRDLRRAGSLRVMALWSAG